MSISIQLLNVVEEDNGVYTVIVQAVRDVTGELLSKKRTYQGRNAEELKAAIKPDFEALIQSEKRKENLQSIAQAVLDEIMTEVVQL